MVTTHSMKKQKNSKFKNIKSTFTKHPRYVIPVVAILFFVLFCVFECVRARIYLHSVADYKNSVKVLELHDNVEKLNESVKLSKPAYFCNIQFTDLLSEFNQAYTSSTAKDISLDLLVAQIGDQVSSIKPAPAYSSLATFLPQPKKARWESQQISAAIAELEKYTKTDVRSIYCLGLRDALSRVYFLEDIQNPEGVSALLPGQLDNFQVNTRQAQEQAQKLSYPDVFEQEHVAINEQLIDISNDLRGDDNNYVSFSRNIEQDVQAIQLILDHIRALAPDLVELPDRINISANALR